jgi:hypothetical protein
MTNWKQYLDHLRISVFSNQSYVKDYPEQTVVEWIESSMKIRCPGNYMVAEFYDPTKFRFDYRLDFPNRNEELMWKLKYS